MYKGKGWERKLHYMYEGKEKIEDCTKGERRGRMHEMYLKGRDGTEDCIQEKGRERGNKGIMREGI